MAIQAIAEDDWELAKSHFNSLGSVDLIYPQIWAVRQHLRHGEFQAALGFMNEIPNLASLADFVLPFKTKLLWSTGHINESKGYETATYAISNFSSRLDLSSYMCWENSWSNCSGVRSAGCKEFEALANKGGGTLEDPLAALSYLRLWECSENTKGDYLDLLAMPLNSDVKALVIALESPGTDGFGELLDDKTVSPEVVAEANRRLVLRAGNISLLKALVQDWEKQESSRTWEKTGVTLFDRLYDKKEYVDSLRVLSQLLKVNRSSSWHADVFQRGIIAAFRSGQRARAKSLLSRYSRLYPIYMSNPGQRWLASQDTFTAVVQELLRERQ